MKSTKAERINRYHEIEILCFSTLDNKKIQKHIAAAQALAKEKNDREYLAYFKAAEYFYKKNEKNALESIKTALKTDRKNALFHRSHGVILSALGKYKDASDAFRQALALNKSDHRAMRYMAVAYFQLNRDQEALTKISEAIDCDRDDYRNYKIKGIILSRLDRDEDAVKEFNFALGLNPVKFDRVELLRRKGVSQSKLGYERDAIEDFKSAIALDGNDYLAKGWLGNSYLNLKEYKKAEVLLKEAVKFGEEREEFYSDYAEVLVNLDSFKQAKKTIDRGLVLFPENEKFKSLKFTITSDPHWIKHFNEQERLLEEEKRKSEEFQRKLQYFERFSQRVIHRVGNVHFQLAGIIGLIKKKGIASFDEDKLETIEKMNDMISKLIGELKATEKPVFSEREKVDVAKEIHVLQSAIESRVNTVRLTNKLDKKSFKKNPKVSLLKESFSQAIGELLENAVRVNKDKIDIRIHLEIMETPQDLPVDANEVLLVKIADNGVGVENDKKEEIFEPLFSTTSGNGLGLSIVKSIVAEHGGFIKETGTPGKGACFELYFPIL